ncbi:phage portal protein [Variovorax paradoxus]|uniref:Phage portal protein n=1 Tax=Variovorax paradoxus TaxID=34073 RepID=A0A6I6HJB3_VARPD|nr:phage portal protein [Variovorax paradoxus]QGW82937.1 phage portal protein [Variovorax paradoxus]
MNIVDRIVGAVNPLAGLRRAQARRALAHYEGAKPNKQRVRRMDNSSPDTLVGAGAAAVRAHARYLERNHDISRGALRVLVNNVVGPTGIGVEPQPRRADGSIHSEYAALLREAHRDWQRRPEVTGRYRWPLAQRLTAYTWLRDGEAFAQQLVGPVPFLNHGTRVPYSLELFEPDFVPLDYDDPSKGIRQGIQSNAWGEATGYWVYKGDPREGMTFMNASGLKFIPAERMLHTATIDRLHQRRGVSEFASVITRGEDLKDYEESERIAAKVAASLTAYVKRNETNGFQPENSPQPPRDEKGNVLPRDLRMQPGMILDTLTVGEEVGMIDSNRPNPNLIAWRAGQLRAFCAGIGASYSSVSRDYDGSYSAQRQELVEQWVHYAVLADEFVGMFVQPSWETFVQVAHLSGAVPIPSDVVPGTEDDALFIGQSMPWIDPMKEANAWEKLVQAGFASEVEVIRRRGGNPHDVIEQVDAFRKDAARRALVFSSNAATPANVVAAASAKPEPEEEEEGRRRK